MAKNIVLGQKPTKKNSFSWGKALGLIISFIVCSVIMISIISLLIYYPHIALITNIIIIIVLIIIFFVSPWSWYEFWEIDDDEIKIFIDNTSMQMEAAQKNKDVITVKKTWGSSFLINGLQYNLDMLYNRIDEYTTKIKIAEIAKIRITWKTFLGHHGALTHPIYLDVTLKDQSKFMFNALAYKNFTELSEALTYLEEAWQIPIDDPFRIRAELGISEQHIFDYLDALNKELLRGKRS